MHIATKTLEAIEQAIVSDQGAKYRGLLRKLMPLAEDAYREHEDPFRSHLGGSLIGGECAREIWYSWRWTTLKQFEGRMVRLFNRGHLEEPRMIALLMMIGCEVWFADENGKQFRMLNGYKGHYGGGLDGVARGIPDLPLIPMLTEYKTHGEKSFKLLTEQGVLKSKWKHFIQMQKYMGNRGLTHGIYMATNKNTDHIHAEIIEFDSTQYQKYNQRAAMIIDSPKPPPKINQSPGWFVCKMCDQSPVCHGSVAPARNCRTCRFIEVGDAGAWKCGAKAFANPLTKEQQLAACTMYSVNPDFKK